jgi:hypothetical protein
MNTEKPKQIFSINMYKEIPLLHIENNYLPDNLKNKIRQSYNELVTALELYKKDYITPLERLRDFDLEKLIFFLVSIKKGFRFFEQKVAGKVVIHEDYRELHDFNDELYDYAKYACKKTEDGHELDGLELSIMPTVEEIVRTLIYQKDKNYRYKDDGIKPDF